MKHRWKGSALVALIILTQVASAQEVLRRRIEPRRINSRPGGPNRAALLDPKAQELMRRKSILHGMQESAFKLKWDDVAKRSKDLDQPTYQVLFHPLRPEGTFRDNPIWGQEFERNLSKVLHKTTLQLAEQTLRLGDPMEAKPLFHEVIAAAPEEVTPFTRSLFKDASLRAADLEYENGHWEEALRICDEILKQQHFSLDWEEKGHVFLTRSGSRHWSEAASLPRHTLVVDHIGTNWGSYFHVFGRGAGGPVDVWVRADTVRELLDHPDFSPARDLIAQGSDLLLTPSITQVEGWQESLRYRFPETTLWSDPYIGEASQSLAALHDARLTQRDFSLDILLPKNDQQATAMGLRWTGFERSLAWGSAKYLRSNVWGVVDWGDLNADPATRFWRQLNNLMGPNSKKDVLDSLKNSKGVIILFAHGDREGVYTPEGDKLTVEDVRKLDLHTNRPVVLLLSCEGNGRGTSEASASLAQELKKSGATTVLSFPKKVAAAEASSVAVKFLEGIRSGKTPLESFRSLSKDRTGPEVHLKVQLKDLPTDARRDITASASSSGRSGFSFGRSGNESDDYVGERGKDGYLQGAVEGEKAEVAK